MQALHDQFELRIEGKIWRGPATPRRTVYKKSQSSSTPCFTKGAAVNPTKITANDRKAAESKSTRAITNSDSVSNNPIRNQTIFPLSPSHSETLKAK